jgi:hypothetical protein
VRLDPEKLADLVSGTVGIGPLPLSIAFAGDTVYALADAATRLDTFHGRAAR